MEGCFMWADVSRVVTKPTANWCGELPSYNREWNMEVNQQRQISPVQWDPGADSGLSSFQSSVDFFWNGFENTSQLSSWIYSSLFLCFYPWCPHPFTWCETPSVTRGLPNLYFYPRFPFKVPSLSIFQMASQLCPKPDSWFSPLNLFLCWERGIIHSIAWT